MDKRERNLWVKALKGSGKAYRKLGVIFWQGKRCKRDRELARLCLQKAAEMGDERGYFLYHGIFSRGKKIIDDFSYEEMYRDYIRTGDLKEKKRLERYLRLGRKVIVQPMPLETSHRPPAKQAIRC